MMKRIIKTFLILLGIIVLGIIVVMTVNYKMNQEVQLTRYEYQSEKLPQGFDGYKIAVISDIHNSPYTEEFISLLNEAKPDMLLFAGDMIQQPETNLNNVTEIIKSQADKIPVYAVFGNHEASNGSKIRSNIAKELRSAGANVMFNTGEEIVKGEDSIRLIGIEDANDEFIDEETLKKIRRHVNNITRSDNGDVFNILLYHRADVYPKINDLPVNLILSGHLHGGIVRLPFVGGVFGKGETYFPEYTSGIYKEEKTTMIVSRGCDYNPYKPRIFNPPEVVLVTLKKQ